jgi:predicted O-methyltransferase YrrM
VLGIWRSRNRQFLAYPPGHYHSPLPDYADIEENPVFTDLGAELPGISLNVAGQSHLMRALAVYAEDHPFSEQPTRGIRYYFQNGFFSYPDALVLHAMLRHVRARRVVEIGSGYSSAVMLDTRDRFLDRDTHFTFIDPEPGRLESVLTPADRERCTILPRRVQDLGLEPFLALEANDILFVDSSHVTKVGCDVNHIMFNVLPALRPGVLVHIHDIFWPFEYPAGWYAEGRAWNEAYLFRAFLQYNSAFEVALFLSYLERHQPELIAALARNREACSANTRCSSLWIRKRPARAT